MKIFKTPAFWTILFVVLYFFTRTFDRMFDYLNAWILQPIPDSQLNTRWSQVYEIILLILLPIALVYFGSRAIIRRIK